MVRHQRFKSFQDSKISEEIKLVQSTEAAAGEKMDTGNISGRTDSKKKLSSRPVLSQIFLHDWWLVKADPDSHGRRLGIGGFTEKKNLGIRTFSSAAIVKKYDAATLQTVDNITIMVLGYLNRSRTLENGFSEEVCDHFQIGFPYNWEKFAALSASEEPYDSSSSKGVPTQESHGNIFEESSGIKSMDSADHKTQKKRRTSIYSPVKILESSNLASAGPLTRSRARLLKS